MIYLAEVLIIDDDKPHDVHKYKFNVDISTDDITWTNALTNQERTGTTTDFEKYTFQPLPAKFVKVTITESTPGAPTVIAQISEIKVFGNTRKDTIQRHLRN